MAASMPSLPCGRTRLIYLMPMDWIYLLVCWSSKVHLLQGGMLMGRFLRLLLSERGKSEGKDINSMVNALCMLESSTTLIHDQLLSSTEEGPGIISTSCLHNRQFFFH
ncbi:uncharacterized protein LOC124681316 isoform X2 [Lolium rigidum]|uniref:uncharacterized protein LOC124681316 isoform X2 n=1 Tax=Lolium rigidum TaxID=89674 RepID=UPI001F5C2288|nr:uncharacterized protein LOC124681316 isoform X2 [Lolium rigidum]